MGSYMLKFCISITGFFFSFNKESYPKFLGKKLAEIYFCMGIQEANGMETPSCFISIGLPSHFLRNTEVMFNYNHYLLS